MQPTPEKRPYPPFHPTLEGCVARDRQMSRALEESYADELYSVAAYTYRSLFCERFDRSLSDLFNSIAVEEIEHFRLLGELILALGGNPTVRTQIRVSPIEFPTGESAHCMRPASSVIADAIREEKYLIDRYETLMSHTEDRVVRSVFSHLISDEQCHIDRLSKVNS